MSPARALTVVALGGNALSPPRGDVSLLAEREAVGRTTAELATLARDGSRLLVVHGNGPQVGAAARGTGTGRRRGSRCPRRADAGGARVSPDAWTRCPSRCRREVLAGTHRGGAGAFGATALAIAHGKLQLGLVQAIALGILCNGLVCLAVWLSCAGRSVTDRICAVALPITAFVAAGLEHSVANMARMPRTTRQNIGPPA